MVLEILLAIGVIFVVGYVYQTVKGREDDQQNNRVERLQSRLNELEKERSSSDCWYFVVFILLCVFLSALVPLFILYVTNFFRYEKHYDLSTLLLDWKYWLNSDYEIFNYNYSGIYGLGMIIILVILPLPFILCMLNMMRHERELKNIHEKLRKVKQGRAGGNISYARAQGGWLLHDDITIKEQTESDLSASSSQVMYSISGSHVETGPSRVLQSLPPQPISAPSANIEGSPDTQIKPKEPERTPLVPFLYHHVLTCDSKGLEITIKHHDVTLRIPEGAVNQGETIHLEIGVAIYGPFYFMENTRPISPIIWLCLLEDTELKKPFQLIVPHFLVGVSEDRINFHKVMFAKAIHHDIYTSRNHKMGYTFHDCDTKPLFASHKGRSYGILVSQHFCFYCLEAKQTPELATDAGYALVRIEKATFLRNQVHFCAIYLLNTCLKSLEEQYPNDEGYKVSGYCDFKFNADDDPYIQVIVPTEHSHCIIAMDPKAAMIMASDIDFWSKNYDSEMMKIRHKTKMYPPRVKMTVMRSSDQQFKLLVKFLGCSMDGRLDVELAFPQELLSRSSHVQMRDSSSVIYYGRPKLSIAFRHLLSLASKWKSIGVLLDIPNDTLEKIEHDQQSTDNCLQEILQEWLNQVNPPPTWTQLIYNAVEPFNPSKAEEMNHCLKDIV